MQLFRLVYYSTNELKSHGPALANELKVILSQSISKNTKLGITGGIVFNRTNFLKVLEGAKSDVQRIYNRISCDPRNSRQSMLQNDFLTRGLWVTKGETRQSSVFIRNFSAAREHLALPRLMPVLGNVPSRVEIRLAGVAV